MRKYQTLLVFCVLIALLGVFAAAGWYYFAGSPRVGRLVTLNEVADYTYRFLKKEFPVKEGAMPGDSIMSCSDATTCEYSEPEKFPTNAWALMPYAALYGREARAQGLDEGHSDPTEEEKVIALAGNHTTLSEETKDALRILHNRLIGEFDMGSQMFSLHQIADAYSLSGFDAFLFRFFELSPRSLKYTEHILQQPVLPATYLTAALARQIALAVALLEDPKVATLLERHYPVITKLKRQAFANPVGLLETSDEIIRKSENLSADNFIDNANKDLVCWGMFARSAVLKSRTGRDRFGAEYFPIIKKFFSPEVSSTRWNIFGLPPSSLQKILPCLVALNDLREIDPNLLDYEKLFFQIFEERILPMWDNPSVVTCRGDGGFFSALDKDPSDCAKQKSLVDNAWLLSIILNTPWGERVINSEI